jgi:hypothetical protein
MIGFQMANRSEFNVMIPFCLHSSLNHRRNPCQANVTKEQRPAWGPGRLTTTEGGCCLGQENVPNPPKHFARVLPINVDEAVGENQSQASSSGNPKWSMANKIVVPGGSLLESWCRRRHVRPHPVCKIGEAVREAAEWAWLVHTFRAMSLLSAYE